MASSLQEFLDQNQNLIKYQHLKPLNIDAKKFSAAIQEKVMKCEYPEQRIKVLNEFLDDIRRFDHDFKILYKKVLARKRSGNLKGDDLADKEEKIRSILNSLTASLHLIMGIYANPEYEVYANGVLINDILTMLYYMRVRYPVSIEKDRETIAKDEKQSENLAKRLRERFSRLTSGSAEEKKLEAKRGRDCRTIHLMPTTARPNLVPDERNHDELKELAWDLALRRATISSSVSDDDTLEAALKKVHQEIAECKKVDEEREQIRIRAVSVQESKREGKKEEKAAGAKKSAEESKHGAAKKEATMTAVFTITEAQRAIEEKLVKHCYDLLAKVDTHEQLDSWAKTIFSAIDVLHCETPRKEALIKSLQETIAFLKVCSPNELSMITRIIAESKEAAADPFSASAVADDKSSPVRQRTSSTLGPSFVGITWQETPTDVATAAMTGSGLQSSSEAKKQPEQPEQKVHVRIHRMDHHNAAAATASEGLSGAYTFVPAQPPLPAPSEAQTNASYLASVAAAAAATAAEDSATVAVGVGAAVVDGVPIVNPEIAISPPSPVHVDTALQLSLQQTTGSVGSVSVANPVAEAPIVTVSAPILTEAVAHDAISQANQQASEDVEASVAAPIVSSPSLNPSSLALAVTQPVSAVSSASQVVVAVADAELKDQAVPKAAEEHTQKDEEKVTHKAEEEVQKKEEKTHKAEEKTQTEEENKEHESSAVLPSPAVSSVLPVSASEAVPIEPTVTAVKTDAKTSELKDSTVKHEERTDAKSRSEELAQRPVQRVSLSMAAIMKAQQQHAAATQVASSAPVSHTAAVLDSSVGSSPSLSLAEAKGGSGRTPPAIPPRKKALAKGSQAVPALSSSEQPSDEYDYKQFVDRKYWQLYEMSRNNKRLIDGLFGRRTPIPASAASRVVASTGGGSTVRSAVAFFSPSSSKLSSGSNAELASQVAAHIALTHQATNGAAVSGSHPSDPQPNPNPDRLVGMGAKQ
ncbi:MAG: hypothetical protein M1561_03845 [Gammaproteobacteria bacterium]|nr:hypothetical protein [Gammaproteobacteria bacterium]